MTSDTNAIHPLIGQQLGKYTVEGLLGEGGMGAVYRAVDANLGRVVAIKVIRPDLAQNPDFVARFKREAVAAARFQHPNAITLYDYEFGESQGPMYLAFEFVKGRELRDLIKRQGGLEPRRAVVILAQVLDALEAAHEAQIVHRDLKPQNVMVEQGKRDRVKILDFGIAKLRGDKDAALTMAGQVMGTLAYMSPEQATGSEVDHRSDIYSVGALLFETLTGKIPFNGRNAIEVIQKHRRAPVPAMASIKPGVPQPFQVVVERAMSKKREDRYQSAADMRDALNAIPLLRLEKTLLDHGAQETVSLEAADAEDYETGATDAFFADLVGKRLAGKYHVIEKLGEGAMGGVFKARHLLYEDAEVFVALKVIHPRVGSDRLAQERFLREARAAAQFTHPNAIPTRDVGKTEDGLLYMTQDFSEGRDLGRVLDETGFLTSTRALGLIRQALLALGEAHRRGIVHRDIKPANMLVEADDRLRVCDFGIAKLLDSAGGEDGKNLTGHAIIGTPYYMSPEQARSLPVDGRADIYSLGCVLYEMLSGKRPFDGDGPLDVVMKHVSEDPTPPSRRSPQAEISRDVEGLVMRAMAKAPEDRFETADEFVAAIDMLGMPLPHANVTTGRMTMGGAETVPPQGGGKLLVVMAALALASTAAVAAVLFVPSLRVQVLGPTASANLPDDELLPPIDVDVSPVPTTSVEPSASVEPTTAASATPQPSPTTSASPAASVEPTTEPSPRPSGTVEPTAEPSTSVKPLPRPSASVEPTTAPSTTPAPSPSASASPVASVEPTPSPAPTPTRQPTAAPTTTPVSTPRPSTTPVSTPRPSPSPSETQVASLPRADPIPSADPLPRPTTSQAELTPVDPFEGGHRPVASPSSSPRPTRTPYVPPSGRTEQPESGNGETGREPSPQHATTPAGVGETADHTLPGKGVTIRLVKVPAQTARHEGRRLRVGAFWMSRVELTAEVYAKFLLSETGVIRRRQLVGPLRPWLRDQYKGAGTTGRSSGRPVNMNRFSLDWLRDGTQDQVLTGVGLEIARDVAAWLELSLPERPQWVAAWQTYAGGGGRTAIPAQGNRVRGLTNSTHEWTDEGFIVGIENGEPTFKRRPEGRRRVRPAPPVGVRFVRPE